MAGEMTKVTFEMSEDLHRKFKSVCAMTGIAMSDVYREAARHAVDVAQRLATPTLVHVPGEQIGEIEP